MKTRAFLALVFLLAAASQAAAHARLLRAAPRVGETVKVSPAALRLYFSESIDPARSSISLIGPAGVVPTGPLALDAKDPRTVIVPLGAALAPGAYHVTWGMTSADTHHTEGDFRFRVAPGP